MSGLVQELRQCAYRRYSENDRYGETYTSSPQHQLNIKVAINFPSENFGARASAFTFRFFSMPLFFYNLYKIKQNKKRTRYSEAGSDILKINCSSNRKNNSYNFDHRKTIE